MPIHRFVVGALLAGGGLLAAAVPAAAAPSIRDTLHVDPGERVVCLSRPYVLVSTLVLEEDGRVLTAGRDYALDPDAGCLTLAGGDDPDASRVLVVAYRVLPLELRGTYRLREDPHRRRLPETLADDLASGPEALFTREEDYTDLSVSGSKTFGVEVGNRRDLKLRQSFDLRLTGQVTRDVSLLAILSDEDIPFQPEGNTAELEELDRVLVQIQSPRAGAGLGDVGLRVSGLSFLELTREVEGFTGGVSFDLGGADGAIATAKGEFASVQFFGEDGRQGPYVLTGRGDSLGVVVVAGSEKVWMDGEPLTRGEEEDYVIDYSRGEIIFTSRRVVTANTEITVDYQFATSRYRRRLWYAGAESGPGLRAGRLQGAYFSEGDDPDHPFGTDLTETERSQLAALGDSATVSGGTRYTGSGEEDYDLILDAGSGREVFVFVDGTGDYQVTFLNVGERKGEYEPAPELSSSKIVYLFVGEGRGSYVPRRDLPAPERRRVADLRYEWNGKAGGVAVEGAFADTDLNVLSPLDDEDNEGGALVAEAGLSPAGLGAGFTVAPRFRMREVGENFESPARLREGFYTRDWNLTGLERVREESLQEGEFELVWGGRARWSAMLGHLALADTFRAVRQQQVLSWQDAALDAKGAWITTRDEVRGLEGKLDRKNGEVLVTRGRVWPRLRGLYETRRRAATDDGERHRDWSAGLVFPLQAWPIRAEVGIGRRLDDSLAVETDAWRLTTDSRNVFGSLDGTVKNLTFSLRYEARRVEETGRNAERLDVGRLDLRHRALRGSWSGVLTANLGTVGLSRRTKSIEPANPPGSGYYDEFGNYVGPGGDYDVVYGPRGDEILTSNVDLVTRLRWSAPGEELRVPAWTRKVAWEGFVNLTEASSLPLTSPEYFFDPSSYLSPGTTIDGRLTERMILDLLPLHRGFGVRLRQELSRLLVRNPQESGPGLSESRDSDNYAATLRSNPAPGWDAELEGALGNRREEVDTGTGSPFTRATDLRTGTVRGGRRFRVLGGGGRGSADVSYSRETGEDQRAEGWVIRPRLEWSLPARGRLDVRYTLTDLVKREGFTGIRGPGAPSLTEGWRLDVLGEIRITVGIAVTAVFVVDAPVGIDPIREGRFELRGAF